MNTTLLQHHIQRATGARVSTQNVRNRFRHVGFYARRPTVCVSLAGHRLPAEGGHKSISDGDELSEATCSSRTSPALVYDLTIGRLSSGENVALGVLLHLCTKVSDLNFFPVWAGVSINGHTDLYILRRALTVQRYRDEILRPIVVPYAAAIGDKSILMEDNARPHRARLVDIFLFDEGILRMDWPVWPVGEILGRRVTGRLSPPESSLLQEWERIPQSLIDNLIDSTPRR
ncbi:hypothetical protein AVEN_166431-1 [Araneus ventricosus]|uniref:Tc1-like transposase DDE domain-containing protein n=1 Tax=Araneus ventricosus TaxID=182803 RepID=A0A4Y2F0C9_ARAVE|nr:hypothetical protein AVEN_166431-1 [Araneus ventricosus]